MKDSIREPLSRGGVVPGTGPFGRGGPRWEPNYCGRTWEQGAVREPDPEPITLTEWYALLRRLGHEPKDVAKVVVTGGTIVVTEQTMTEHRIEVDD